MTEIEKFEIWLRTVCFQKPTPEAYDLAKDAWVEALKGREAPLSGPFIDGLVGLAEPLRDVINIMDNRCRSIPKASKALWDEEWNNVRTKVYKVYKVLSEMAD
jgi:hypothetical protein